MFVKISLSTDAIHRLITASVRCDIPIYYKQFCEKAERLICVEINGNCECSASHRTGFLSGKKKKKDVKQCDIHLHYCKCLWKKSIDSSEVIVASLLGCGGMAYDN